MHLRAEVPAQSQSRRPCRRSCEYVWWPPEQHGREAEGLIATADTLNPFHPAYASRVLSAYLSGHGSMINGNALSSRATRAGRPAFRITKTSSPRQHSSARMPASYACTGPGIAQVSAGSCQARWAGAFQERSNRATFLFPLPNVIPAPVPGEPGQAAVMPQHGPRMRAGTRE